MDATQSADSIVLIGPAKSGKTTVGRLLATQLGVPFRTLDIFRLADGAGLDGVKGERIRATEGVTAWYRYVLPFAVDRLEHVLDDDSAPAVIELARWYVDAADVELFDRVRSALAGIGPIVLLRPAVNPDHAFEILRSRWEPITLGGVDINMYFLRHSANTELAKQVVYTTGRTPMETRDEILARLDPACETVVLIGPIRAGKSTQGLLVAEALGRKRIAMDEVRWGHYKEIGWTPEEQSAIFQAEGLEGMLRYWKAFEIHAVERVLAEHPGSVIDLGAGHSVYDEEAQMARARAALAPITNVVLLLPSADESVAMDVLRDRDSIQSGGMDGNRYFLQSPEIAAMATHVLLTDGRTPEQTCSDVLAATGRAA